MIEVYLIRHGQSTNNKLLDRQERVSDPVLTDLGHRQAELVAKHLAAESVRVPGEPERPYGIERLYCSPMRRALQTARPISEASGLTPEVWLDIHEHGGIYLDHEEGPIGYPGMTRQEMQAAFPGYVLPDGITQDGWWNREYEDRPALHERAVRVAGALGERTAGEERIGLVTHGGFVNALLKVLFRQWPGRDFWYHQYNTGISRLDFHASGHVDVQFLNRVPHLPPELIS